MYFCYNSNGNLTDLGECSTSNRSLWHMTNVDEYNNKKITSIKNEKCLYAANSQRAHTPHTLLLILSFLFLE